MSDFRNCMNCRHSVIQHGDSGSHYLVCRHKKYNDCLCTNPYAVGCDKFEYRDEEDKDNEAKSIEG